MPCDQLELTAVSVSRVYRHFGTTDHLAGRVYRQMSAHVKPADRIISSTKIAIHTAGCQDTSDLRHFGTGAEVFVRHFGTSSELSKHIGTSAKVSYGHFGTKENTSAPGNTGPSHGKAYFCACIIT